MRLDSSVGERVEERTLCGLAKFLPHQTYSTMTLCTLFYENSHVGTEKLIPRK